MEWNIEKLLTISEKEFEKEIEKLLYSELSERLERLAALTRKPDLDDPLETSTERGQKRAKLLKLQTIIRTTRDRKEKDHLLEEKKHAEQWKTQTLKQQLPNLRYTSGNGALHLQRGDFSIDAVPWETPTNTEIMIDNRKVNLQKMISPTVFKQLLEKPFAPMFFILQESGIFRKGELQGVWYDGSDWSRSKNDTYAPKIIFGIMKV